MNDLKVNTSIRHTINQSINQSIKQSVSRLFNQLKINHLISRSACQSPTHISGRTVRKVSDKYNIILRNNNNNNNNNNNKILI